MTAPPSGPGVRVNRRGQLSHGASKLQEKSEVTFSKKNPRVRKAAAFLGGKNAGEIMGCCLKVQESAVITGVRTGREATKRTSCWREAKVTAIRQPRREAFFLFTKYEKPLEFLWQLTRS